MTIPLDYIQQRCTEDADCWLWRHACSTNGTPKVTITDGPDKRQWAVRRYVATVLGLSIAGKLVTTTCGNPRCVCPDHLLVVDKKQMGKLVAKRTGYAQRPERRTRIATARRLGEGKVTKEIVADIRTSGLLIRELAAKHGLAKATVSRIRRHASWIDYVTPFTGLGAR